MLRRVALVRTDDSEELSVSFIRVTRIGELGTTLPVTSNLVFLRSVGRNIPEDAILDQELSTVVCSGQSRQQQRHLALDDAIWATAPHLESEETSGGWGSGIHSITCGRGMILTFRFRGSARLSSW
jgi:hypothetical protein